MNDAIRTPEGEALTDLILTVFRVNNLTLTWGDRLVAPLGLTSARWQILGAIALADRLQPVAWLARDLGANRQNVQRIVNDLAKEGLVEFQPNPHHRRAHLVVLTDKGQRTYDAAIRAYDPRANALAEGLSVQDIKTTHRVMLALRQKLEGENDAEKHG
ncbi:MarR family winged helix-turn-helix transcriptional regulator [Mesorhizobium humile]|jgi:DNA-binding MarR family transcriptional regulator|uniref:MarR family winged helix-turn-helix transcriptional regulator n=1 Tax=Mesorhizobium humile TaxID=3072313 RepID=A0ABU4YKL9_9HYPH|nr:MULTISPECIES: MarR family winged helix-turn-helix transcriptional regulator [unclassified Mesorhizobium]MDX8462235.1 MarR family winged helix-turn-helix transcriptional regulator [Mesorhizobium sp. VK2D]MDX8487510.1 MarR family winged helix-turn-helix transcriptional regulator [Mesorhizobium sp. VK2B]